MEPTSTFTAPHRPGEHLVAGRVAIHDLDAFNDHLAREAVDGCPEDVSGLGAGQLTVLKYAALRLSKGPFVDRAVEAVLARVCREEARRGRADERTLRHGRAA